MIKVVIEDLSEVIDAETGHSCGGGYGIPVEQTVYIDSRLTPEQQRFTLFHEVIELKLPHLKHSRIDPLVSALIEADEQWRSYDSTKGII